jgi:hypothetical protein
VFDLRLRWLATMVAVAAVARMLVAYLAVAAVVTGSWSL